MLTLSLLLALAACGGPSPEDTPAKRVDTSDGSGAVDTGDTGADTADTGADSAADTSDSSDTGDEVDTSACVSVPVADAGPDPTVDLDGGAVQLDGTASGGCGPYTYFWAIQAKPSRSGLESSGLDRAVEDPTFTPDASGTYEFSFQVYDGQTWASVDMVSIAVR